MFKINLSPILVARVKSFVWRLAGVMVIAGLNWLAANLGLFNLGPMWVTIIGLVIGEITKFLNVNLPEMQAPQA